MGPAGTELSEMVACLPGVDTPLPRQVSSSCPGGRYAFTSDRRALDRSEYARCSAGLLGRLEREARALVGVFPGLPGAFTAIRCGLAPGGLEWETWHSYPQTREVVHTATTLRRR